MGERASIRKVNNGYAQSHGTARLASDERYKVVCCALGRSTFSTIPLQ